MLGHSWEFVLGSLEFREIAWAHLRPLKVNVGLALIINSFLVL